MRIHCSHFNRIVAVDLFIVMLIGIAWSYSPSIALRIVILFLGTMSALYATWDIILDGLIHKKQGGSNVRVMAEAFHGKKVRSHSMQSYKG